MSDDDVTVSTSLPLSDGIIRRGGVNGLSTNQLLEAAMAEKVWVGLTDGRWALDPVFTGTGWVIECRDGNVTMSITANRQPSNDRVRAKMVDMLRKAAITATIMSEISRITRFMPNKSRMVLCAEVDLVFTGLVPGTIPIDSAALLTGFPNGGFSTTSTIMPAPLSRSGSSSAE